MGLFASLNIHYNKNTKVQKQNETDLKKLKTKVCDSVISGSIAIHFSNRHQIFLNFQEKQTMTKLSGIRFHNTNRLHIVLVITIYLDKTWITLKYIQVARLLVK